MPVNFAEQLAGNQAFVDRVLGLTENLRERPVKEKERKVREQAADRTIGLSKKLDKVEEAKIDVEFEKLNQNLDYLKMEDVSRQLSDIKDKDTYTLVYPTLPKAFKESYGLKGPEFWEKGEQNRIDYLNRKALHSTEQKRKLEQIRAEGIYKKTTAPYVKPDSPRYFDIKGDGAAIKSAMSQHPEYRKMTGSWRLNGLFEGDPFSSPRIMHLASEVVNDANQLMYESHTKAVETRGYNVMGPKEAFTRAMDRKLAILHNSDPRVKDLEFLSPEDAEKQRVVWISTEGKKLAEMDPRFKALPLELQERALSDAYEQHQMGSFIQRRGRGEAARLYAE